MHNDGIFILDGNVKVDTFTGAPNKEDIQPPAQMNEESKTVENNSSIISHKYFLDIPEVGHMQRKFEMD